jgi:chromosome segregation ATPase
MEQNQNALFERFHQAITSMEAQLISLYEEKVQQAGNDEYPDNNGELDALRDAVKSMNDALSQAKTDRDNLQSEVDALKSRCVELENTPAQDVETPDTSALEEELKELRGANEKLQARIEELQNARPDDGASAGGESCVAQQTMKVMRKNIELAALNEELGNKLTAVAMNLEEARSEVQRLKAIGEQEMLSVKKELIDELQRVKGELQAQKARFRDLGASIMEKFFAE